MYDFREQVIKIMKNTLKTETSMRQAAQMLNLISSMYLSMDQKKQDTIAEQSINEDTAKLAQPKSAISTEKSEANDSTKNLAETRHVKIIKKSMLDPELATGNWYQIKRLLSGALATDIYNQRIKVAYFNEKVCQDFNLQNGDYVDVNIMEKYNPLNHTGKAYIRKVRANPTESTNLMTFGPAIVKQDNQGNLYVNDDVNQHKLMDYLTGYVRYQIKSTDLHITQGDIVLLAWYKDKPDSAKIRWIYPNNHDTKANLSKPSSYYKDKTVKDDTYQPKLAYDLAGKRIALISDDLALLKNDIKVINAHEGVGMLISTTAQKSNLLAKLHKADGIVLIQSHISHEDSQVIVDEFDGKKIALAKNSGQLEIEKAAYRAINLLPVYDTGFVDYPLKKLAI